MKKLILLVSCMFLLLASCNKEEYDIELPIQSEDFEQVEVVSVITPLENRQIISFGQFTYLFIDGAIFKMDEMYGMTQLLECVHATMTLYEEALYMAVLTDTKTLYFLKIDAQGNMTQKGEILDVTTAVDFFELYDNCLYIQFKNGLTSGYQLDAYGQIKDILSEDDLSFYSMQNKAISTTYGVHIVEPFYSNYVHQIELLAVALNNDASSLKQVILRQNGEEIGIVQYYGTPIVYENFIYYQANEDSSKLNYYNFITQEEGNLVTLADGTFSFVGIDKEHLYGVWGSDELGQSYLAKINLNTTTFTTCFKLDKTSEILIYHDIMYQREANSEQLNYTHLY